MKYKNQPSVCLYQHSHRSKLERAVCDLIWFREKAGEIKLLQVEAHVYLTKAKINYIPDFKCLDLKNNEEFYIEAKGYPDAKWPIKKKLWRHYGPARLEIWMGTHTRPSLEETIIPETSEEK